MAVELVVSPSRVILRVRQQHDARGDDRAEAQQQRERHQGIEAHQHDERDDGDAEPGDGDGDISDQINDIF